MSDAAQAPIDIQLPSGARYPVVFGPLTDLPSGMAEHGLRPGRCVLITDRNVAALYGDLVTDAFSRAGWDVRLVVLPAGEETKSLARFGEILDAVLEWGIDRRTPLVALGGGVVGDIGGFAAATMLRGLPLVHAPTTLLAQVDSSIGGKTGINHRTGKNLVGAFHQPRLVWTDHRVLGTLSRREWTSGAAEVVKHALIAGDPLHALLNDNLQGFLAGDPTVAPNVIREAVSVKARIVEIDELESGIRAFLNFGHTFAHALERVLGYGTITHGEAVAIGMRAALHLSAVRSGRSFGDALEMVETIAVPAIPTPLDPRELRAAMGSDKKTEGRQLRFILLEEVGSPCIVDDVTEVEIASAWRFALRARD